MPDKRLIDANALLKEFEKRQEQQTNEYCDCFFNDAQEISTEWWCVEDMVMSAPTIDAVEVVHGRWVFDRPNHYKCSLCDAMWSGVVHFMKFCPNCGAKMDGGAEE